MDTSRCNTQRVGANQYTHTHTPQGILQAAVISLQLWQPDGRLILSCSSLFFSVYSFFFFLCDLLFISVFSLICVSLPVLFLFSSFTSTCHFFFPIDCPHPSPYFPFYSLRFLCNFPDLLFYFLCSSVCQGKNRCFLHHGIKYCSSIFGKLWIRAEDMTFSK